VEWTYPKPAIGAVKSDASIFASRPASLIVVYRYLSSAWTLVSGVEAKGREREEKEEKVKEKGENRRGTYVQIIGTADLGIPPPSSLILIVISSLPSTTTTLIGGNWSSLSTPNLSTTALREFLSSSKQICDLSLTLIYSW
jgi:hypothetical protein